MARRRDENVDIVPHMMDWLKEYRKERKDDEAVPALNETVTEAYMAYMRACGGPGIASQKQFAVWLGINPSSVSNYMAGGNVSIAPENEDKLVAKIGPWFSLVLGRGRRLPEDDRELNEVVDAWPALPDAIKKKISQIAMEERKKKNPNGGEIRVHGGA